MLLTKMFFYCDLEESFIFFLLYMQNKYGFYFETIEVLQYKQFIVQPQSQKLNDKNKC